MSIEKIKLMSILGQKTLKQTNTRFPVHSGSGHCKIGNYFRCQILSLYSLMVRSEEKMPEQAVLVIAMRSHFSLFW